MCAAIETKIPECNINNHDWKLIFFISFIVCPSNIDDEIISNTNPTSPITAFVRVTSKSFKYLENTCALA